MILEPVASKEISGLQYLINNFAQYNLWANATIVHWLKSKSAELMDESRPSSFASIRLTLQHTIDTQMYWFAIITKSEPESIDWATKNIDDVFMLLIDQSAEVAEMIETMSVEKIEAETTVINPWFECNFANFEYIVHMVNHTTYHRGQIVNIGRQLGFTDAPMTDYNFYNVRAKS